MWARIKFSSFATSYLKFAFGLHFGAPKPSKTEPKMLQIPFRYRVKKLTNFEGDFDRNLAPTWAPTWSQVGLQEATKTLPKEHLQSYPAQDPKNDAQKHQKLPNTLPKSTLKKLRKQRRTLEKHTDNEHEKHQQTKRKSKQQANPSLKVGVLVFPVGARRDSRSAGSIRRPTGEP